MSNTNQFQSEASIANLRSEEGTFSSDPAQIKYKKAVREISKLINLVKSLRNQIGALQTELDEANGNNQLLQEKIKELQNTIKIKSIESNSIPEKAHHDKELQNTGSISEFLDAKKRVEQLQHLLTQKQKMIHELESLLDKKHIENVQIYEKCEQMQQQLEQLKSQKQQQAKFPPQCSVQKQLLQTQLKKSQHYIRFLTEECNRLKQEQIKDKIIPSIPNINSQQFMPKMFVSPKALNPNFNMQKHWDPKKMQQMKDQLKHKREKYKKEVKKLKGDVEFYQNKYERIFSFVEKQQKFIERCVVGGNSQNTFGQSGNFNYFNNHSVFTQNQEEHDVYKL